MFGASFRIARQRTLSQEQVAEAMQVRGFDFHQATVYKIENGKRKVTVGEALALSDIVNVPLEVLTEDPDSPTAKAFAVEKMAERVYSLMGQMDRLASEGKLAQGLLLDQSLEADRASAATENRVPLADTWRPLSKHPIFRDVDRAFEDVLTNPATIDPLTAFGIVTQREEEPDGEH